MSRITDYGFLFQTTFGTSKTNLVNNIQLSQMNSSSVQKQLKAAGIDTNSKKYKAALSEQIPNDRGMNLRGEKKDEFTGGDRKKIK